MDKKRRDMYLRILESAVLNVRMLSAEKKKVGQCQLEAEHVHNSPKILMHERPEDEDYYWEVERTSYMEEVDPSVPLKFAQLWSELQESRGSV